MNYAYIKNEAQLAAKELPGLLQQYEVNDQRVRKAGQVLEEAQRAFNIAASDRTRTGDKIRRAKYKLNDALIQHHHGEHRVITPADAAIFQAARDTIGIWF